MNDEHENEFDFGDPSRPMRRFRVLSKTTSNLDEAEDEARDMMAGEFMFEVHHATSLPGASIYAFTNNAIVSEPWEDRVALAKEIDITNLVNPAEMFSRLLATALENQIPGDHRLAERLAISMAVAETASQYKPKVVCRLLRFTDQSMVAMINFLLIATERTKAINKAGEVGGIRDFSAVALAYEADCSNITHENFENDQRIFTEVLEKTNDLRELMSIERNGQSLRKEAIDYMMDTIEKMKTELAETCTVMLAASALFKRFARTVPVTSVVLLSFVGMLCSIVTGDDDFMFDERMWDEDSE